MVHVHAVHVQYMYTMFGGGGGLSPPEAARFSM